MKEELVAKAGWLLPVDTRTPSARTASDIDRRSSYFPQLDGLRGVAILTVLVGHFSPFPLLSNIVGYGDTGVVVFFCLSGFLITNILLGIKRGGRDCLSSLVAFYSRRALRIFPVYYLAIGVAALCGHEPVISNRPCPGWVGVFAKSSL